MLLHKIRSFAKKKKKVICKQKMCLLHKVRSPCEMESKGTFSLSIKRPGPIQQGNAWDFCRVPQCVGVKITSCLRPLLGQQNKPKLSPEL